MFLRSVHGAWAAAKSCAKELMRVSSSSSAWTTTASNVAGSLGLPFSCRPWGGATRGVCRHLEGPRESRDRRGLLANQLAGQHQVPDQLSLVRVLEARLGGDLARLADVVEQAPGGDQVAIELGVVVADAPADLH